MRNLEKSKETNAVMQAGNEWYNTKEVQDFAGVLERASQSEEAQRLSGHVKTLDYNVSPVKNGAHINNEVLEARLNAIEKEIEHIEHETTFPHDAE